eukprot:COSAG06_NODE_17821_length_919_cov_2.337805_1_plen_203_part_10
MLGCFKWYRNRSLASAPTFVHSGAQLEPANPEPSEVSTLWQQVRTAQVEVEQRTPQASTDFVGFMFLDQCCTLLVALALLTMLSKPQDGYYVVPIVCSAVLVYAIIKLCLSRKFRTFCYTLPYVHTTKFSLAVVVIIGLAVAYVSFDVAPKWRFSEPQKAFQCSADGKWDGGSLSCITVSCPAVSPVAHATPCPSGTYDPPST